MHLEITGKSKLHYDMDHFPSETFKCDFHCDLHSTWDAGPVPTNRTLLGSIVVPFPVEGDLSGKILSTVAQVT